MRTLAWGLAALLGLAGCASPPPPPTPPSTPPSAPKSPSPLLDSWPIGPEIACADGVLYRATTCDEIVAIGQAGLDARDPGHAPVASVEFHEEGVLLQPETGRQVLYLRSGGGWIVLVFRLADGSERAIGVGAPGTGPVMAIPREIDPSSPGRPTVP